MKITSIEDLETLFKESLANKNGRMTLKDAEIITAHLPLDILRKLTEFETIQLAQSIIRITASFTHLYLYFESKRNERQPNKPKTPEDGMA